jgi:hypothetical protein
VAVSLLLVKRQAACWCLLDRLGKRGSGGSEPAAVGETGCLLVPIGQAG